MDWEGEAKTWDEDPVVQAYAQAAFESLRDVAKSHSMALEGARVLDFGCGTGVLAEKIARAGGSVIAADQSPGMIEVLRRKIAAQKISKIFPFVGSVDPVIAKGAQLFGGRFDLIVCSSVCAFLDDYLEVVNKLAAALNPGGAFVQWDWEYEPRSPEPFGLTRVQIEEALTGAGLTRVEVEEGFNVVVEGMRLRPLRGVGFR